MRRDLFWYHHDSDSVASCCSWCWETAASCVVFFASSSFCVAGGGGGGGGVSDVELSPILKHHEDYDEDEEQDNITYEQESHVVALDSDDPTADETSTSTSSSSLTSSHHVQSRQQQPQEDPHSQQDYHPSIPAPPTPMRQPMMPEFHTEPPQTPDLRHSCVGTGCPTAITTTKTTTTTTTHPPPQQTQHPYPFSQHDDDDDKEDPCTYTNTPTSSPASTKDGTSSTKTHRVSNKTTTTTQLSETPTNTSVLDAFLDTSTYSLHQVTESFTEAFCPPDDSDLQASRNSTTFAHALLESTDAPEFGGGSCGDVLHQYSDNTISLTKSIQHQLQSDFETLLGCGDNPTDDELVQVWRKDTPHSQGNRRSSRPTTPSPEASSSTTTTTATTTPLFQLPHKRASLQRRALRIHQFRQEQEVFGTTNSTTTTTTPRRRLLRSSKTKTNIPSLPLPLSSSRSGTDGGHHAHPPSSFKSPSIVPLRPRAKSQDDSKLEYSRMTLSPKRSSFSTLFDNLVDVPPVEELGKILGTTTTTTHDHDTTVEEKDDQEETGGYDSDPGEISHYVETSKHSTKDDTTTTTTPWTTADMSSTSLLDHCEESSSSPSPRRLSREEQEALEEQQRKYVNVTPPFGGGDAHIQNAMNTTYTLKWLGTNTMVPVEPLPDTLDEENNKKDNSSPTDKEDDKVPQQYRMEKKLETTPTFVRMWIERGTLLNFGQTCIEPQIMWRPIFADVECTKPNIANVPPESIRLMAICRILDVTEDHFEDSVDGVDSRKRMFSMDQCFVLKNTKGTEYIFEASSKEERNEIVQLWKYAVARLASLAMVGEEETMAYEFFTADATLQGGQPIY
mmetsp:Transcript_2457/g.3740  ORF Transcript_2457/g.3740 Transcript_2457/m.3740 type:complete len:844 (+) Transcript_2457:752-3283(+)